MIIGYDEICRVNRTLDAKAEAAYRLLNFPFWKIVVSRGFERVYLSTGLDFENPDVQTHLTTTLCTYMYVGTVNPVLKSFPNTYTL